MHLKDRYRSLVVDFSHHISDSQLDWCVAAGNSATLLAKDMLMYAKVAELTLPRIFSLSRDQSHSMYLSDNPQDPIVLLSGIVGRALMETSSLPSVIHFLDDYTLMGKKAEWMNDRLLARGYIDQYAFRHHVMVARSTRLPENIEVFRFDTPLAEWLDQKSNG